MNKKSVPPLDSGQVKRLAETLGEVTTGGELDLVLSEARLPASDISTKWRRLRDSFERDQSASGSANSVLRFVKILLTPSRFTDDKELFERVRSEVNKTLSFSGLRLEPNGDLVHVSASRTIDEARLRADRLRARLEERNVHADVLSFCRPELTERNYFHAVLEATKSVAEKIRRRTGLEDDGSELAQNAFSLNNPALMVNDLATPSERNKQTGISLMAQGMFSMFRNPTAHTPKVLWAVSEEEVLDLLTIASMLHRRLDAARFGPGAPNYQSTRAA